MGKAKNGGTRSFLRGKVGSDVYSIGKDGKGKKQQVVRSLAVQVANPQTLAQMRGRMIMSTVMQAVSALRPIIDHSFDGIAKGQPSISEFIRTNYALIKADVEAHPASGNHFGLVKYQEKGAKGGQYVVSSGSAVLPAIVEDSETGSFNITVGATATAGAIRTALNVVAGDYLTFVVIGNDGKGYFSRLIISDTLADDTAITDANVAQLFDIEGNGVVDLSILDGVISLSVKWMAMGVDPAAYGLILSVKDGSEWKHSTCKLRGYIVTPTADTALPTYPIGEEQFLNGGNL